jgi:hypothetical protein
MLGESISRRKPQMPKHQQSNKIEIDYTLQQSLISRQLKSKESFKADAFFSSWVKIRQDFRQLQHVKQNLKTQ